MVRGRGLEPPHLAALVPKTSVSTNFTTRANCFGKKFGLLKKRVLILFFSG